MKTEAKDMHTCLHFKGGVELKEWKCVEVGHHKNISAVIEDMQKNGWHLHTYQATGQATLVSHYLLFEKGGK